MMPSNKLMATDHCTKDRSWILRESDSLYGHGDDASRSGGEAPSFLRG